MQDQHLRPAEQRRIEREAGIFGGCAHQRDGAAFDEGEKAILLRAVETVNLVHEQQRALPGARRHLRLGKGLFQIGNAGKYRADGHETHADGIGEQAGDAGLARPWRTP